MAHCFRLHTDTFELVWSTRHDRQSALPLRVDVVEGSGVQLDIAEDAVALREETTYTVLVKGQAPVLLTHRHPSFFSGMSTADDGHIMHGTVNFGSQVGYSDITVLVGSAVACTFCVEVYPSKIDYQRDYVALRDAVSHLHADLALSYLQRTYQLGRAGAPDDGSLLGWVFMLRSLVDELSIALHHIARRPHQRAERIQALKRPEHIYLSRAKDVLPPVRSSIETSPEAHQNHLQVQYWIRTEVLWEHTWLRAQLLSFAQRLHRPAYRTASRSTHREHAAQKEIDALTLRLYSLADLLPTGHDSRTPYPHRSSLLFEHAPGYREAYQICNALQDGLDLHGDLIPFEVKDIHQLYEYWCYLTVVSTTVQILGIDMPLSHLVALREDGVHVRLWQGKKQALTVNLGTGDTLTLAYNPRYSGPAYLVPQQPDIVLTLQPASGPQRRYILDAKYRLDASSGYINRYGAPGPPREALNDLHRYRDALREHDGAPAQVEQAIVLFPYHDTLEHDFATSRLRRSIYAKGIGALPMLPNNTSHLEQWLYRVLTSLPE